MFKKPETFEGLDLDALRALSAEAIADAQAIMATDDADLTDEKIAEAEELMAASAEIDQEVEVRETADAERTAKIAALRDATKDPEPEPPAEEVVVEEPNEEAEEPEGAEAETKKEVVVASAPAPKNPPRRTVAMASTKAPEVIVQDSQELPTIVAAANVPGYASGAELDGFQAMAEAFVSRARGFGGRNEEGLDPGIYTMSESAQHFGVAKIKKPATEFETGMDQPLDQQMQTIMDAAREHRLPGGSLVAAGGWCAPSEIWYDSFLRLEDGNAGLLSIPEVTARRGGINFTKGPDFATLYANANFGFTQTEAQAIADTAKPCYAVVCPPFTEVRLDAVGFCITAGILTNAAYPELIRRVLELALVGQRRRINAYTISKIVAFAGTAINHVEVGSATAGRTATTSDVLDALTIQALRLRYTYLMSPDTTIEVILPVWAKEVLRADLSRRNGVDKLAVTDAELNSFFSARGLSVQYVYDFQDFNAGAAGTAGGTATWVGFPTVLNAVLYPAGAFVRLTADVIDLDAIYDSVNIKNNNYTAAFFEEGVAVANVGATAVQVSIAINVNGSSGFPAVNSGTGVTIP